MKLGMLTVNMSVSTECGEDGSVKTSKLQQTIGMMNRVKVMMLDESY